MPRPSAPEIRQLILKIVEEQEPKPQKSPPRPNLNQRDVLNELQKRLKTQYDKEFELAILIQWNDLFRTGYLGWGLDLNNPQPGAFLHITDRGRRTLERLSRDPGNPHGYLAHARSSAQLNPITDSYLTEALSCFVADLHKSAAVMIGAAAESLVLELRDATVSRLAHLGQAVPKRLTDWKPKTILDALKDFFDSQKSAFPVDLREEFEAYWLAFAQQIRTVRNDAGHPLSVDPVTYEAVHASFLVFTELARLSTRLNSWVAEML